MCKRKLPGNGVADGEQDEKFYFMALGNGNNCYCTAKHIALDAVPRDPLVGADLGPDDPVEGVFFYEKIDEAACNVRCPGVSDYQCGTSNVLLAPTSR